MGRIGLIKFINRDERWTHEYEDTIHVFFQRFNASFVVALGFFPVKRPEGIIAAVKIAYHVRFLTRIFGVRVTFARVVNYCLLLPLALNTTYLYYGHPLVAFER